jgi:flagellar M-ring protein FliF
VKSTVGFNEKRGDVISVEALIAPNPHAAIPVSSFSPKTEPYQIDKNTILYFLILFVFISAAGTLIIRRVQHKKRQLLLLELTQWLNHHE